MFPKAFVDLFMSHQQFTSSTRYVTNRDMRVYRKDKGKKGKQMKRLTHSYRMVWALCLFGLISFNAHAVQTAAPAAPNWGLDPVTGTILKPGISVTSMGTLASPGAGDGDHSIKMFDTSNITPDNARTLQTPDVHTHHHWDVGSIGNIYGLAIDSDRNIYATASTHYGAGFGFSGDTSIIRFGSIGDGTAADTAGTDTNPGVLNSTNAAGTIYKIDKTTGNASIFAQLPQQSASFTHVTCENIETVSRNTGPALGNITFDPIHNQFFVSNFEDGKIYRLSDAGAILSHYDPFLDDDGSAGLAPDARPYGLAVSPDGKKLYFGTHELNTKPRLFAVDLTVAGEFTGVINVAGSFSNAEVNQNATLIDDLTYTQNIGGGFFSFPPVYDNRPGWVSYSDLKFSPNGELIIGLRTGCGDGAGNPNFASSHNHGGAFYLLIQDGSGLYNTPAPQVPGNTNPTDSIGDYDAGSFPIHYSGDGLGPDDGYGGVAIYDKGTGKYDYLVTSADIEDEPGPHGFLLFPENFTATGSDSGGQFLINPGAPFSAFPSSTNATGDYKGSGGDIEVLSVLMDWGDAPDTYGTDLISGNSSNSSETRGPTHILTSDGILLGSTVDHEFNGVPSVGADSDDNLNTPDDEDGISTFPELEAGDTSYLIPLANVTAANSSGGPVTIHAWIDFDGNGTFDPDEYTTATVNDGATNPTTDLSWSGAGVSNITQGTRTYARFRITDDPSINSGTPGGRAINGEVEDYSIDIPPTLSLGSTVFSDNNNNGTQDGSEAGISGVTVKLFASDGTTEINVGPDGILNTLDDVAGGIVTDGNGDYLFSGLKPGSYIVKVTPPASAPLSSTEIGSSSADNNIDGDDNGIQASSGAETESPVIVLGIGAEPINGSGANDEKDAGANTTGDEQDDSADANGNMTVDFGFVPAVSLGSTVFSDENNNGVQDGSEAGITGVTVKLFASDGATEINVGPDGILNTGDDGAGGVATDANGDYLFSGLLPGSYVVKVTPPASAPNSSTDIASTNADNDIDGDDNGVQASSGADAVSPLIALAAGSEPSNGSGINDEKNVGANTTGDNQDDGADNSGNMTVDFGFVPTVSLGSTVFFDNNNNGLQDGSEAGISGVTVKLFASDGTTEINVGVDGILGTGDDGAGGLTTDSNGDYLFTGLLPGNYVVKATPPASAPLSSSDIASSTADNNIDGDDNGVQASSGADAVSPVIALGVGSEPANGTGVNDEKDTGVNTSGDNQDDSADTNGNMTVDFGFVPPVSLGSTVFLDNNNNGQQDGIEAGISGVTVKLFASDGTTEINVGTDGILGTGDDGAGGMTTDVNGDYFFQNLNPGSYIVKVTPPSSAPTSSTDIASTNLDNNIDGDDNGVQASSGADAVSPVILLIAGTEPVTGAGVNDEQDTGGNSTGDDLDIAADASGNMTVDFGFVPPVSLGSTVFADDNNNGTQDGSEAGIPGVTVKLFASDGTTEINVGGDGILGTGDDGAGGVLTNASGDYQFTGLLPGSYIVKVTPPASAPLSSTDIASSTADNDIDGDDNGTQASSGDDAVSPLIVLVVGAEPVNGSGANNEKDAGANLTGDNLDDSADANGNMTVDFGFVPPVSLGSTVFSDDNNNGLQDGSEAGISGVTVKLFASDGSTEINVGADGILGTGDDGAGGTVTNGSGDYYFSGLAPGSYIVKVTPPTSAPVSSTDIGSSTADNDIDGDDNGVQVSSGDDAVSPLIVLTVGGEPGNGSGATDEKDAGANTTGDNQDDSADANGNMTVDFGFVPPVSLGSTVFSDDNNNGLQDGSEAGITGVTVKLFASDGTTEINVGADGILGTGDDGAGGVVTNASGDYLFTGLLPGSYVVKVTPPASAPVSSTDIASSTADNDIDGDDNGTQASSGDDAVSPVIVLAVGAEPTNGAGATDEKDAGANNTGDNQDDSADANGNMTVDFGFVPTLSLGSTVFSDDNNNGLQDGSEAGINGVTVKLFASDGTTEINVGPDGILGNTDDAAGGVTTDTNGDYLFTGLLPGSYIVKVTPPAASPVSSTDIGSSTADNDIDGDDNGTQASSGDDAVSPLIVLTVGGEPSNGSGATDEQDAGINTTGDNQDDSADANGNMTVDFGFVPPVSLGSTVFADDNNNGIQDGSEDGISGVTVKLFASDGTTEINVGPDGILNTGDDAAGGVSTDSNGDYLFTGLNPGSYVVKVTPPATIPLSSTDIASSNADNDIDGDDNGIQTSAGADAVSPVIVLGVGAEPTDGSGVNDEKNTGANTTGDNQDDSSDANGNMTVDFGFVPSLSIGSVVWDDSNSDGIQDALEPTLENAVVALLVDDGTGSGTFIQAVDIHGVNVDPQITLADGLYDFNELPEGLYKVVVTPPPGYVPSPIQQANADGNVANDSNIAVETTTPGTYESGVVELLTGDEPTEAGGLKGDDVDNAAETNGNMTVDFGFVQTASVNGRVWIDTNTNNNVDDGLVAEQGVVGVMVNLIDVGPDGQPDTLDDIVVDTTTTGANGLFSFTDVTPSEYFIEFEEPTGMTFVVANQPGDDTIDSDADEITGLTDTFVLNPGQVVSDIDAGVNPGAVGDRVWLDVNQNGVQDAGEPGVPGITVDLLDSSGTTILDTTVTGVDGIYAFNNLAPGDYIIEFDIPAQMNLVPQNTGLDDSIDSDVDPNAVDKQIPVTVISGPGNQTYDAGIEPAFLGNFVWLDSDNNGEQDAGEPGIEGVTVELLASDGTTVVQSTTTDANGEYGFAVIPDDYIIHVVAPAGVSFTTADAVADDKDSDVAVADGKTTLISLASGDDDQTWDAGVVPANLSGTVFLDLDADGVEDAGELGIDAVTITLTGIDLYGNPVSDTTTTDSNGDYSFTVAPGTYTVVETDPTDFSSTGSEPGTVGSSVDSNNQLTVTIVSGDDSQNNDFLDTNVAFISGQVRFDTDVDGDTNDADSGISGVTIELLDDQNTVVDTAVTDGNGDYSFTNVQPGDYTIRETDPAGHISTADVDGANDNLIAITLPPGGTSTGNDYLDTIDTGVISGQVRLDSDADGDVNDADTGIAGVTIELLDDQANVVDTTVTDGSGNYSFTNVQPGDYTIRETDPTNHTSTADVDGANDNTIAVTLPPGGSSTGNDYLDTIDTGIISGQVRLDSDADGDVSDADTGIAGVTIELLDDQANVVDTAVTDGSGNYSFTNVQPGDYTIREVDPANHTSTADVDGANDNSIAITLAPGASSTGNDYLDSNPDNNSGVTGVVWLDTDKDGVKDPDESGLPGWQIQVIDNGGSVVEMLTTQPDGTFSNLDLVPGDYTVQFISPGGIIIQEQSITLNPGEVAFVPEPIDPSGIVYNEETGDPVPGAQVFLINSGVPLPAACVGAGEQGQITGVDGVYMFFLNPGADPACPVVDTVYEIQVIPPPGFQTSVVNLPEPGILDADNCTIDAVAGITCEPSDQISTPIIGIPTYFIEIEIGDGDPGIFNNHIPLEPPSAVAPPVPGAPVKPIPTLSEWGRIILVLLIGMITLIQQGRVRKGVIKL